MPLTKEIAISLLGEFLGYEPSEKQVSIFMGIMKKGNSEHLCLGDLAFPLQSKTIRNLRSLNTSLGKFITNPNEFNHKEAMESLQAIKFPVTKMWIRDSILYITFERKKLKRVILKEVARQEKRFGNNDLLQNAKVTVNSESDDGSAKSYRGKKLAHHVGEMLKFAGASVQIAKYWKSDIFEEAQPVSTQSTEFLAEEGSEFDRLVSLGMAGAEMKIKEKKPNLFDEVMGILDLSIEPPKDQKKGLLSAMYDVYKDVKNIVETRPQKEKEPETRPRSYTIENVPDESYPVEIDKIFTKRYSRRSELSSIPVELHQSCSGFLAADKKELQLKKSEVNEEKVVQIYVVDKVLHDVNIPKSSQYICSSVANMKSNKNWKGSSEDLCKILVQELRLAAEQKHRDVNSPEWNTFLEDQAWQCMTLQVLGVAHSSPVKVEVDGISRNTRESAFILYSYAKLCSIFDSFEESVSRGEVPPLPCIDNVDLELLSSDEEWALIWRYILHWPDIVEENAKAVLEGKGKFRTAAVTQFLGSLAHRVSTYYGRYHVLSEPLPHLLPTLYARLHLLKSIKIIMEICFDTLGIESPASFI